MPVKFKIKVVKIGNSLRVTIPKEITEAVDLKKGNMVEVYLDDDKIIIRKL
jgi:AbrB family looped-hinge helix DNA binding protein